MKQDNVLDNICAMVAQHEELGRQVKAICGALKDGCARSDLAGALDTLVESTAAHFVDEEKLMRLYGFDGLESHSRTHEFLSNRFATLRDDMRENFGEVEKKQLLAFLETDFQYHIIEDLQAWERGEISKKFAYQRLQRHESGERLGNLPYEIS